MSDIAIKFENISKQYRLGVVGTGTISHDLNRWWHLVRGKEDPYLQIGQINDRSAKATSDYVWALKDINFEVKQGDVVGIIGKNGAGKSTLLKILSRVTSPSTGAIKAKGRIASLLEVGTGFHPELTGRENIYMNGAIMGMSKAEISRKLDEIIDFAGVEMYIDTPAKRYSSGMTVRLGFAIAAHLEPEILVVDEVLAVGDAEFQKKAIGKMQDVSRGEGRTVLFVSHNMGAVRSLCNSGVVLKDGQIDYISTNSISKAVDRYLANSKNNSETPLIDRVDRGGIGNFRFTDLKVIKNTSENILNNGEQIVFQFDYDNNTYPHIQFLLSIYDSYENCVLFMDSSTIEESQIEVEKNGSCIVTVSPDFNLPKGSYSINIAALYNKQIVDHVQNALSVEVTDGPFYSLGKTPIGKTMCFVKQDWKFL